MDVLSLKNFLRVRGLDPKKGIRQLRPGATVISLRAFMQPILETDFINPPNLDAGLASAVCHNQQWLKNASPKLEWTQIHDPENEFDTRLVGASGTAVRPGDSKEDVWFTHPFGRDFEFEMILDPQYKSLLAASNLTERNGQLKVEMDGGLIPSQFRCQDGDRVAVFGRWISDCGHTDFHTEIHPPLILASARPASGDQTHSTVVGRPYLVSQVFNDGTLREHLVTEIKKCVGYPGACTESVLGVEVPLPPGIPCSQHVEAHPKVYRTPFSGVHSIKYFVRPPSRRQSPSDTLLVSFHFTVRTGVTVQVFREDSMTVGVLISMNAASYSPPPLPQRNDYSVSGSDFGEHSNYYWGAVIAGLFIHPLVGVILARGVKTHSRDTPIASSVHDTKITTVSIDNLGKGPHYSVDNGDIQPFPIYGWLDVRWERR